MGGITTEEFVRGWQAWRAGWEQWLVAPHGWLSARSRHWLGATPARYPGLPGRWCHDGDGVIVNPEGTPMSFGGESFDRVRKLALAGGADDQRVVAGELEIGITHRDGYLIIVYDPETPTRVDFRGVPTFEPDPDWVRTGRYEPDTSSGAVLLGSVGPGLGERSYDSPGTVHLEHEGRGYALRVLGTEGSLHTVFADATSGNASYGAGRSLAIPEVGRDGRVVLDFNRAVNLPCAFSDNFPICPAPPPGNRLPFAVVAGERSPR